jgi:hypothetical protein
MILLALALAGATAARPLPLDVRRYIERREGCDHWRGEFSPDPVRSRQIEAGKRKECTGGDRELDRLRRKYHRTPGVLAALSDYDKVEVR